MNERPGYGDAEAKRILERAAQIDAEQGRQLDAPALREIAAEAGISPLAVERALQEHESTVLTREPWLRRHRAMVIIAAMVAALLLYALLRRVTP
jgi:DNA-binding transcriptional regulator YhcF (GntR family)